MIVDGRAAQIVKAAGYMEFVAHSQQQERRAAEEASGDYDAVIDRSLASIVAMCRQIEVLDIQS